jgi:hypothetical protein
MKNEYGGSVSLICKSCGSKNITVSDDKSHAKCNACQREYAGGYDELVRLNLPRINDGIEKMKKEILNDAQKDIEKMMKDAFKGNKFFKLK